MIFFDRDLFFGTDGGQSLIDESIGDAAIGSQAARESAITLIQSPVDPAEENPCSDS
jgi:hypothetical protein